MKTIEEIEAIARDYTSGPVVHVALQDAIKWIGAYRRVASLNMVLHFQSDTLTPLSDEQQKLLVEAGLEKVDAYARKLVEGK